MSRSARSAGGGLEEELGADVAIGGAGGRAGTCAVQPGTDASRRRRDSSYNMQSLGNDTSTQAVRGHRAALVRAKCTSGGSRQTLRTQTKSWPFGPLLHLSAPTAGTQRQLVQLAGPHSVQEAAWKRSSAQMWLPETSFRHLP